MSTPATSSLADLLATPESFSRWLQAQDRNGICGSCGLPGACPVAMWLLDAGVDTPSVGADDVEFYVGRKFQRVSSPEWLKRFVRAVDNMFPRSTYGQHPRITAEEALGVLDVVCADLALVRGAA